MNLDSGARSAADDGSLGIRCRWCGRLLVICISLLGLIQLTGCRPADRSLAAVGARATAQLTAALATGDRAAFEAVLSAMTEERRAMLWRNLYQLGDVEFLAATGDTWQVAWRVPGETGLAWHELRVWWSCKGNCRVTELSQRPGKPTPIWLVQPIGLYLGTGVAIIGDDTAANWLTAAHRARAQLATADAADLLRPPELLIFELPRGKTELEQVLAAPATDFQQTGALTWLADSGRPATREAVAAPPRVVVNPLTTTELTEDQQALLLAHEAVHAATGWLGAPVAGRRWVSEGLAESVALELSADEQARSLARLRQLCPIDPTPPQDSWFADLNRSLAAYAWSAWAVAQLTTQDGGIEMIKALWADPEARWSGPVVDPQLCA